MKSRNPNPMKPVKPMTPKPYNRLKQTRWFCRALNGEILSSRGTHLPLLLGHLLKQKSGKPTETRALWVYKGLFLLCSKYFLAGIC